MDKLKSRKLWMGIAGIVGNILLGITGAFTWEVAFQNVSYIIIAYMGANALAKKPLG